MKDNEKMNELTNEAMRVMEDSYGNSLWMLLLLMQYQEDPERFKNPKTETVMEYFYKCPECGRKWGDEYSAPRFCPDCGVAPRKTFRLVDRLVLRPSCGHCACVDSE